MEIHAAVGEGRMAPKHIASAGVFLGIENFRAWRHGGMPENDGVDTRMLVTSGPYRWVRHPMYAGTLLLLWAVPHWTVNLLAFSISATLYLYLGSLHEERRLLRAFGDPYREYMARTPRFIPRLRPR
jgi:protein-S-isoprenylcysteine O-methyltransferase Ste14